MSTNLIVTQFERFVESLPPAHEPGWEGGGRRATIQCVAPGDWEARTNKGDVGRGPTLEGALQDLLERLEVLGSRRLRKAPTQG